jgi:hypothetical protein
LPSLTSPAFLLRTALIFYKRLVSRDFLRENGAQTAKFFADAATNPRGARHGL